MSVGRFRSLSRLLLAALVAAGAPACSLDTNATSTGSSTGLDGGPGGGGAAGGAGGGGHGGTSGTGGSSGTGAVGGAPDGGSAGQENCFDQKDNNGDGFVDCGDPACQTAGYTCKKSPPSGWEGYFRTAGDPFDTTNTPPSCPDGSPPEKYLSNPGSTACTPCTCGALTGACSAARIDCSQNKDCNGATDWSAKFQSCSQVGYPSELSCRLEAPAPASGGSCPPSGGELSVKQPWGRWLYACGAPRTTGGGCVLGQSCAAPGSGAYSGSVCIRKAGEQSCPPGWSTRLVGYQDATDTRGCAACTCTPVQSGIVCSPGEYTFYDHHVCKCGSYPVCQGNKVVNSTSCVDVSNLLDWSLTDNKGDWGGQYTKAPAVVAGTCTPSGGQPTGSIQTTGAVTYCCL